MRGGLPLFLVVDFVAINRTFSVIEGFCHLG